MGAHLHSCREAANRRACDEPIPLKGIRRKGHRRVPSRRSAAMVVEPQHVDVNLMALCAFHHEGGGYLAGLVPFNQTDGTIVANPLILAPDLLQDEAAL